MATASTASSAPDQRHLRLIAASAQANEARIHDILAEESSWTSQADHDALRQALVKVATRGNLKVLQLLLEHSADVNPRKEGEVPALFKAAEGGHVNVVTELLRRGADPNSRNRTGQTALYPACMRGHNSVVKALLAAGADADGGYKEWHGAHKEWRTPLLFLASEKPGKWDKETVELLVGQALYVDTRDSIGRTALLWAATSGYLGLAEALLSGDHGKKADIAAFNKRGKTALHLAAENNHVEVVKLLLKHGANPHATSDGGWTPLHNAAQNGHAGVVAELLSFNANVNARLTNDMTPLHWAASEGHEDVVKLLLENPETNVSIKDGFYRMPMLCAAEKHHNELARILSPARAANRLSKHAQEACKGFDAVILDFGKFANDRKQLHVKESVYDLLYGWDNNNDNKPLIPLLAKNVKYQPDFRWIHLPANNISWVETLLAKAFIEAGHRDIDGFKELEKCFDQEHRGHFVHANFMRSCCHRIASRMSERDDKSLNSLSEDASQVGFKPDQTLAQSTPQKQPEQADSGIPKSEAKKKSKSEQIAERHPTRPKRAKGHPGNPPGSKETKMGLRSASQLTLEDFRQLALNGKMVLFMPFLHYETDERRVKMTKTIENVVKGKSLSEDATADAVLIAGYLNNDPPLHPRRTLDQYFYHGIDTSQRDQDQVVYRYCRNHDIECKIFMVDQLWLWILGGDTVITCFPQRWEQPKHDPLNVVDGIIEETNAKTRPPIQSVYDLAMLIVGRCSGMFDRHRLEDQDYQFLDIFESSIGNVTNRESELFSRFHKASAESAKWLKRHRRSSSTGLAPSSAQVKHKQDHVFPDALLNIDHETKLLAEIKDIRDELNIIAVVLESQEQILNDFEMHITDELRGERSRKTTDAIVNEIRKRSREHIHRLEVHRKDVDRMDRQAEIIYTSLTNLLDLKQKHSNALEARFARDQAVIAARQGQTIMVFTIVTIIFLPMSFIAAFFAINFQDWNGMLTIGFVSKYTFGIGLSVSFLFVTMAFLVHDIPNAVRAVTSATKEHLSRLRSPFPQGHGGGRDEVIWEKSEDPGTRRRISAAEEIPEWRKSGPDGPSPHMRFSHDRNYDHGRLGLSPVRYAPRKFSTGSGRAVSWARPSLERARGRTSDDLEKGRDGVRVP